MDSVITLFKPRGYTPLQLIEKYKKTYKEYENITLGYAGRLDPMAEGLIVILTGEENKKRKEYERLDKKYSFEILFGISTDTYDIMGMITDSFVNKKDVSISQISELSKEYIGTWDQPYPPYSSPRVKGKPLFYWARKNELHTIQIPSKKVSVKNISLIDTTQINSAKLLQTVQHNIGLVKGDFRQEHIMNEWRKIIEPVKNNFTVVQFEIECSSGVYIRSLANDIGKKLEIPSLAFSIRRTAVGPYTIENALRLTDT